MSYRQKHLCQKPEDLRLISETHKKPNVSTYKTQALLRQMRNMEKKTPMKFEHHYLGKQRPAET